MTVIIKETPFNPYQELQEYEEIKLTKNNAIGASNIFIGTMRDFNEGDHVKLMSLEHYPGMTEKQLNKIIAAANQKWALIDILIIHRVGDILPNEPIVLVSAWSSHRGDAFDACRFIMENLKSKAPFWKKERLINEQERWVISNTKGYLTTKNY